MIPEIFTAGTNVKTAFGALGLLLIVLLFAYYRKLRSDEIKLRELPAEERPKALDSYVTRYGVDAHGLGSSKRYDLIRLDLEKRASRVTFLTSVLASVFLVCFTIASFLQRPQAASAAPVIPGDLTAIFGVSGGGSSQVAVKRVELLSPQDNTKRLNEWFSKSQKSIKIVTITGASWIVTNHMEEFRQKAAAIPVTLMLLDFTDPASADTFNDAMNEYHESVWRDIDFKHRILEYSELLGPQGHLTLGLYREYPWSRFTIFDGRAVSFIVTPVIEAGDNVNRYFSEDPFVVRCFEAEFAKITANAARDGRMFTDVGAVQSYLRPKTSGSNASSSVGHKQK
jgi:hypothetical protein